MTTCIIAEKPSVARDIARIVGAKTKQDGYLQGCGYLVTWAMGHLITLAMPEAYGYEAYKAEDLPNYPSNIDLLSKVQNSINFLQHNLVISKIKYIFASRCGINLAIYSES